MNETNACVFGLEAGLDQKLVWTRIWTGPEAGLDQSVHPEAGLDLEAGLDQKLELERTTAGLDQSVHTVWLEATSNTNQLKNYFQDNLDALSAFIEAIIAAARS